ncbi:MAG: aminotransferase class V-fold PLP-dependent enzyme [Nocardioides sp.]
MNTAQSGDSPGTDLRGTRISRFPGVDEWARFDGPAGTLPVDTAVRAISDYLGSASVANLGGTFVASTTSDAVVAEARDAVAVLVGARADEVVFGPSTTTLMFAFTRALSRHWRPGDRIVCTQLDHDSNVRPWELAARDVGAEVAMLPVDPVDGTLDVEPLRALCADGRARWLAISGASNLIGYVPDLPRAIAIAREYDVRVLVDGVARVPHLPTDLAGLDIDVMSTSPYKWYGPHAGALIVRNGLLSDVEPYRVRPADYPGPSRWETGTAQVEVLAGVAAAARYLIEQPVAEAGMTEHALCLRLVDDLRAIPGIRIHGPGCDAAWSPTISFSVAGRHPDQVARSLAAKRIAVWSGDNYACELVDAMGLRAQGGVVRAGISRYTTNEDIDRLLAALR